MARDIVKPKNLKAQINVPFVNPTPPASRGFTMPTYNPARYDGGMGKRSAFPLPDSSKGPIRARQTRKEKGISGF